MADLRKRKVSTKQVATMPLSPAWLNNGPNRTLKGHGFYISYNPDTSGTNMSTIFGNMFGGDLEDGEETALCKDGAYKILTGDFREQYEKLVPQGYEACLAFFKKMQPKHGNNWSTEEEDR